MTEINREQITLAAYNATGPLLEGETPEDRDIRFMNNATDLFFALDERSPIAKHLSNLADSTAFIAVIVSGGVEKSSGRAVIQLQTKDGDGTKEEPIRTDHLNTQSGKSVYALAKQLRGRRVLVYKQMEVGKDKSKKYRVLRHLVDLGPAEEGDES